MRRTDEGGDDVFARITLPGRPITKKNSQVITKAGRIIPSKQYREYEEECLWRLKSYRGPKFGGKKVWLKCEYYMPNRRSWPDLIGLLQATQDILEKAGIYDDDKQVVSLDGSRIAGVDKESPRAEIRIEEVCSSGSENVNICSLCGFAGTDNCRPGCDIPKAYKVGKAILEGERCEKS